MSFSCYHHLKRTICHTSPILIDSCGSLFSETISRFIIQRHLFSVKPSQCLIFTTIHNHWKDHCALTILFISVIEISLFSIRIRSLSSSLELISIYFSSPLLINSLRSRKRNSPPSSLHDQSSFRMQVIFPFVFLIFSINVMFRFNFLFS